LNPAGKACRKLYNFDSFSNITDPNNMHSEKDPLLMTSRLAGMKMFFSPVDENAYVAIR
jgi:hypothetical protein